MEALLGRESEFVRTPKYNVSSSGRLDWSQVNAGGSLAVCSQSRGLFCWPRLSRKWVTAMVEVVLGLYMLWCAALSVKNPVAVFGMLFLLLFAAGYFYVGFSSLFIQLRGKFAE